MYESGLYSTKSSGAKRTIKGFSTSAGTKMAEEPMFLLYSEYYDSATYADDFVVSALDGTG